MNYFFGGQHNLIQSKLQIPLFQNRNINNNTIKLFQLEIKNNLWIMEKLSPNIINSDFYEINDIDNQKIFFLSDEKDIKNFNSQELVNISNFTETFPEFRANLNMYLRNGGFSSYQSEYPFNMVNKKGTILTPINTLLNKGADENILIFRNIFFKPIKKKFVANFIDIKQKKIIKEISFFTNTTNFFEIDDKLLDPNIYLSTQEFIGVPIYLSIKNKHLSMEHTHPPHEYFLERINLKM